jgi:CBS domain containing-hemolysin-like protein
MTLLLLLVGEITPKRLALRYAETLAPGCARWMLFWSRVLAPFNGAFRFSSRVFAGSLERERRALSDAELVSVVRVAASRGEFAAEDAEMISGVLRLSELCANDEMTPRVDMEGCDCDLPEAEWRAKLATAHHRFLPLFRRSPDAIEGVVERETGKVSDALFVPEQVTLDDLLVILRKSGRSLAIVTDEYGGTAGLITVNDILEIVMGPRVFGKGASDEPSIVQESARVWTIDGRASLDEINRTLGVELEAEDADRLAGWTAFHAERIPHVGQSIEADGCRATVLKRRRRRVVSVRLEVLKYPEAESDAELLSQTDAAVEKTEEDNQ